jgi:hypothetical protein
MEGNKIYLASAEELAKIRKSLASDTTTINWHRLDERSKSLINKALSDAVIQRQQEVQSITLGVQ